MTRRHELIIENGIQGPSSPLVDLNEWQKANSLNQISIFPNPIQERFTIALDKLVKGDSKYTYGIYSINGQLQRSGVFNGNQTNIDRSPTMASGLYFLKVIDENGQIVGAKELRVVN
ncbi:MAG: T9SS type A sorting domain-containing protein [Saprospiraceae bacterium]|nr:T9SS type A sorting domain-containing protein [Saprospiraceae bacterium]